ncbi:nucleotidyltransferase [Chlamydiota bacterium]
MKNNYKNIFDLVYDEFEKANIAYVLVGGFSLGAYGVMRQTMDVDFIINEKDLSCAKKILEKTGYKEYMTHDIFSRFTHDNVEMMDVDLLLIEEITLNKILEKCKNILISNKEIPVPCLNHLIALKLHAIKNNEKDRIMKDLPDIVSLIRENKIDVKTEEFKELSCKFGNREIYEKLLKFG